MSEELVSKYFIVDVMEEMEIHIMQHLDEDEAELVCTAYDRETALHILMALRWIESWEYGRIGDPEQIIEVEFVPEGLEEEEEEEEKPRRSRKSKKKEADKEDVE